MNKMNLGYHGRKAILGGVIVAFLLGCSFLTNFPKEISQQSTPTAVGISNTPSDSNNNDNVSSVDCNDGYLFPTGGENFKIGYMNRCGEMIIQSQFEDASFFHEGLALATLDKGIGGLYGYIDTTGNFVIEPKFQFAMPFSEGLAAVALPDGLLGYIDKTGEFVVEPKYSGGGGMVSAYLEPDPWDRRYFHGGFAIVTYGVRNLITPGRVLHFFIDRNGNALTSPSPLILEPFSEGLAVYGDRTIIDTNGQIVLTIDDCPIQQGCTLSDYFSEGVIPMGVGDRKIFIDKSGKKIIDQEFSDAKPFSEGLAAVKDMNTGLWGYIDHSGTLDIPYQYLTAGRFSEGLAVVVFPNNNQTGGYIDQTGKLVINEWGYEFRNGLALLTPWIYADRDGNRIEYTP